MTKAAGIDVFFKSQKNERILAETNGLVKNYFWKSGSIQKRS